MADGKAEPPYGSSMHSPVSGGPPRRISTQGAFTQHSRQSGLMVLLKIEHVKDLLMQQCFRDACRVAIPSALLATLMKLLDHNLKWDFLNKVMPEKSVYHGFNAIMGTLIVFRTVQALSQYREGASLVYQIMGSWYDAASTLISFTRASKETELAVCDFQHTVIRLFSLLNMLCLAELENKNPVAHKQAVSFDIIDTCNLDLGTLNSIKNSPCKVEVVAQHIQCMIVDGMSSGLLSVPPPIITRAFQDLGNGLMKFHTALNIAHVAIPLPYVAVTEGLLALHAIFTPLAMCVATQGPGGAFIFTFITVLLLWSFSFLATELDNPFGADTNDLPVGELQYELNVRLQSLFHLSKKPTPRTALNAVRGRNTKMMKVATTLTASHSLKHTMSDFFGKLCNEAEQGQEDAAADGDGEASETPCFQISDPKEDVNNSRHPSQQRPSTSPPADVRLTVFESTDISGAWYESQSSRPTVLEQAEQLEQKRGSQKEPQSLRGTAELARLPGAEALALAALHLEEHGDKDYCARQGLWPGPRDIAAFEADESFGRSDGYFQLPFRGATSPRMEDQVVMTPRSDVPTQTA